MSKLPALRGATTVPDASYSLFTGVPSSDLVRVDLCDAAVALNSRGLMRRPTSRRPTVACVLRRTRPVRQRGRTRNRGPFAALGAVLAGYFARCAAQPAGLPRPLLSRGAGHRGGWWPPHRSTSATTLVSPRRLRQHRDACRYGVTSQPAGSSPPDAPDPCRQAPEGALEGIGVEPRVPVRASVAAKQSTDIVTRFGRQTVRMRVVDELLPHRAAESPDRVLAPALPSYRTYATVQRRRDRTGIGPVVWPMSSASGSSTCAVRRGSACNRSRRQSVRSIGEARAHRAGPFTRLLTFATAPGYGPLACSGPRDVVSRSRS